MGELEPVNIDIQELDLERTVIVDAKVYARLRELFHWCVICGEPHGLEAHHIIYRSQGGKTILTNLVLICHSCHERAHGIPSNGRPTIWVKRNEAGALIVVTRKTGKFRLINKKPHEPSEEEAALAHQHHREIVDLMNNFQAIGLELGERLRWMREEKGYLALGYDTFNEYLADPELPIKRSRAYTLIGVIEQAERLELEASSLRDISKDTLRRILPLATPETVDDVLADCRALSPGDLSRKYFGSAEYEPPATFHQHKCAGCGEINQYPGS